MRDVSLTGWAEQSDDAQEFLATVQKFIDREFASRPVLREWDGELIRRAGELGLQAVLIDEDLAIDDSQIPLAMAASELVAARSPALAMAIGCARIHGIWLTSLVSDAVQERWLERVLAGEAIGSMAISEADAGSDVRAIRTVAHRVDGGWSLTGDKTWITLGPVADFSIVLAKIESPDRSADMGVFLVERGGVGVRYGPEDPFYSFSAVPVGGLGLQDAFVSDEFTIAATGGFKHALRAVNYARLEAACLGVGILRGSAELALDYSAVRSTFGTPLSGHQAVQLSAGRTIVELEAARTLLGAVARQGLSADSSGFAAAKVFATEAALGAAGRTISTLGATGLLSDGLAMQLLLDAKAAQIFDGASDILYTSIAKAVQRRLAPATA